MNPDNLELTNMEELRKLREYAFQKIAEMENISKECISMGLLSRVGDSKVPEKDKTFYNIFSFKISDGDAILETIRPYKEFYEDISAFVKEITDLQRVNWEDLRRKISWLKTKLSHLYNWAKCIKHETSNKTIYNTHKSFITEHEKLANILTNFENAVSSEMLTAAHNGWRGTLDIIVDLRDEMRNTNDICLHEIFALRDEIHHISDKNSYICHRFDTYRGDGQILVAQIKQLNEKVDQIYDILGIIKTKIENHELAEKKYSLSAQNGQWDQKMDNINMSDKYTDICYTYDAVSRENKKIVEKQDALTAQNRQSEQKTDKINLSNEYNDICYTYNEGKSENQKIAEKQDALTAQNKQSEQKMDKINLSDEYNDIRYTYDAVKCENQEKAEKKDSLKTQNGQSEQKMDKINLSDGYTDICYTYNEGKSENQKIAEKQDALTAQNKQSEQKMDKINLSDEYNDIRYTYDAVKCENQEKAEKKDSLKTQNGQSDEKMDAEINNMYTDISQKYEVLKTCQDILLVRNERLDRKVDDIIRRLRRFNP